jgi:hypothetical protein
MIDTPDSDTKTFSMVVRFPSRGDSLEDGKHFKMPDESPYRLSWTTMTKWPVHHATAARANQSMGPISIDHFSTFPIGYMPIDSDDCIMMLIDELAGSWNKLCDKAEDHISSCVCHNLGIYPDGRNKSHKVFPSKLTISQRLDQLKEKGEGHELIFRLAKDAQTWSDLRKILKDQMRTAQGLVDKYSTDSGFVEHYINDYKSSVEKRIIYLEESVRDMLHLVSKKALERTN